MRRTMTNFAAALLLATTAAGTAVAEKPGGILRIPFVTSPASMSIHEESTIAALGPMMGVFNNLVMFDQHVPQNSLSSIVPDLAESWTYAEDGKSLTFKLRQGVKWHDGKPFTAKDVKCTWDLIAGNAPEKLRVNPRKSWYRNLESVSVDNDHQATFNLKRPQPSFIALLASGWSPIYPCHVPARDMRLKPIGTGPFKFVSYKPNEFTYIGSLDQATGTCSAWRGSGLASFDDLLQNTTLLGAVAPSGVASEYPRSMNALFGMRIRVVHGYEGTGAIRLAMQRGEVQGSCAFMLSSLKSAFRDDYQSGQLVPVVQFARKSEELRGVPHVLDFARSELERQVFNLIYNRDVVARSLVAPPGIAPERTAMLRAAFDAAIKDTALIDTLTKAGLPLNPMSGAVIDSFVQDYMASPPEAVAWARAALETGKDENWRLKSVAGTIIHIGASEFEVKDKEAKSYYLTVSEADSTIMLRGRQASLASLSRGMGCFVRYTEADVAQIVVCK